MFPPIDPHIIVAVILALIATGLILYYEIKNAPMVGEDYEEHMARVPGLIDNTHP